MFHLALLMALQDAYGQGVTLLEKGRAAESIPLLLRAVGEQPTNAQYHKALGVAYASLSEYRDAEPAFEKACRLRPALPDACYFWSRALYALDRFEASLDALRNAPADGRTHLAAAQALEALGRQEQAEVRFRQAIAAKDSAQVESLTRYGLFLFRSGRLEQAVAPLKEALAMNPNFTSARFQLGRVFYQQGLLEEAIVQLSQADTDEARLLLDKARRRLAQR